MESIKQHDTKEVLNNFNLNSQGSSKVYGIRDQGSETGWDQGSHP